MCQKPARIAFLYMVVFTLICLVFSAATQWGPAFSWESFLPVVLVNFPGVVSSDDLLLISEVMYDPSGDEPAAEWIELYNSGRTRLSLDQFMLGDAWDRGDLEGMLRFPPGAEIAPGQVVVIANRATAFMANYGFQPDYEMVNTDPAVPDMLKYTAWASRSIELTDTGDEVLVLNANETLVDAVSWGNSTNALNPSVPRVSSGHSLERKPAYLDRNLAADWIDQSRPAPGQVDLTPPTPTVTTTVTQTETLAPTETGSHQPPPTGGPVDTPVPGNTLTPSPTQSPNAPLLISEVLVDPTGGEPQSEWLEVFNPAGGMISLELYKIGDEEMPGGGEGLFQFPPGASAGPGQAVVIANQAAVFFSIYGFYPDFEIVESEAAVPNMVKYVTWSGGILSLNNLGDEVLLLDGCDQLVDSLSWGNSSWAFNPAVPRAPEGHSLERYPAYQDTDSAADWRDQWIPAPGQVDLTAPTATVSLSPPSPPLPTTTATSTPRTAPSPTPSATTTISPTSTPQLLETPTATVTKTLTATATGTRTPTMPGAPSPTPTITPLPTAFSGILLISEVMYDSTGLEPEGEWLELYNPGSTAIRLEGFKVGDEEARGGGEGMLAFPAEAVIGGGQVIVIANRATAFSAAYGFNPDYEILESDVGVANLERYTDWASGSISLSNSGDEVLLLDGAENLVDALSWGSSSWAFTPAIPGVVEGHSLERYPAGGDTDSAADWRDQSQPRPGEVNLTQPTATATVTRTATLTGTATGTMTASPTGTVTPSPTPTGTATTTLTGTATATLAPTGTGTATGTMTASPTGTVTPSPTPTGTATATLTGTATITTTSTSTGTSTASLTPTGTATATVTLTHTPVVTASLTPTMPTSLTVLISEVLYDAFRSEPDEEWVELYNPGNATVSLAGFKVGDEETRGGTEAMLAFPDGAAIASGQVLVIANQSVNFFAIYGFKPDYEMVETDATVPNLLRYLAWGTGDLNLNNDGDEVLLLDRDDTLVDALSWGVSTWAFMPAAPDVQADHSLERYPPGVDTNSAADWRDQPKPLPGVVSWGSEVMGKGERSLKSGR